MAAIATNPIIPFNRAWMTGREFAYMSSAAERGHLSGDGAFTKKCQELLKSQIGTAHLLLTTSCTHALEMAALLLNLKEGDEVIIPSFTFVSTVNAFVLRGVKPVFADIRPDTLNIDEQALHKLITPRTRAIVPVHYAGVACAMDEITAIAREHDLAIVEDNAHGLFGKYRGRFLGTFGQLGTLSFHETKNFTCGEGGALLVNDMRFAEKADIIREKGTNRSAFIKGVVDKYTWVEVGSSYVLSDVLAAFLYAQLEARQIIQRHRKHLWDYYYANLANWAAEHGVRLPRIPDECDQAYHMFHMVLPSSEARQRAIASLGTQGIASTFHYLPLHMSPCGARFGGRPGDCPVTEDISARLLRLPFHMHLTDGELQRIVTAVKHMRI
jgi:dTDP-4-amino-4,6-dideoxygalactose transaminase